MLCSTEENPERITRIEKYIIIDILSKDYPTSRLCEVLNILPSSFYKWIKKGKPLINNFNYNIAEVISVEHKKLKGTYGTLRLKHHIFKKYNMNINHKCIRRYKDAMKLKVCVRKKRPLYIKKRTEIFLQNKVSYIMNCNFSSKKPLHKLSSDITYIKCKEGTLYLSAIKDLFNNEIISYSTSINNDMGLVKETIKNLDKAPSKTSIINTDQGSQYLSYEYVKMIEILGYTRSMSKKGCCWQNSPIENWFSQLKEECLRVCGVLSYKETKQEIKKYVQWYNTVRIQKGLGYLSPLDFKNK